MFPRAAWLLCLTCLGCQAVLGTPEIGTPEIGTPTSSVVPHERRLPVNQPSSGADPAAQSRLSSAPVSQVVALAPAEETARFVHAESLFAQGRHEEARARYEQMIAECQEMGDRERRRLLHCHGKLLALAQALDDDYEVQLRRGIGLWLLAQERAGLGDPAGEAPVEGLLCKAAACLAKAHALQRDQARPCWYLHEVWRQLGQPQQAKRWLQRAQAAALFTPLTPDEQRQLLLAGDLFGT